MRLHVGLVPVAIAFALLHVSARADDLPTLQMSEGIQLLTGGETVVHDYFLKTGAWPPNINQLYTAASRWPAGTYVQFIGSSPSADGKSYGMVATMKNKGNGIDPRVAGKAVEIWSSDGGASWHCGPASINPVDPQYLPASCRESGAP